MSAYFYKGPPAPHSPYQQNRFQEEKKQYPSFVTRRDLNGLGTIGWNLKSQYQVKHQSTHPERHHINFIDKQKASTFLKMNGFAANVDKKLDLDPDVYRSMNLSSQRFLVKSIDSTNKMMDRREMPQEKRRQAQSALRSTIFDQFYKTMQSNQ